MTRIVGEWEDVLDAGLGEEKKRRGRQSFLCPLVLELRLKKTTPVLERTPTARGLPLHTCLRLVAIKPTLLIR